MRRTTVAACGVWFALCAASFDASARSVVQSVSELLHGSDLVALMRCEGAGTAYKPSQNTYASMQFSIEELYKGEWRNPVFVLRQGAMPALRVSDCEPGQLYVLFLRSGILEFTLEESEIGSVHHQVPGVFEVVGGQQGMWKVEPSGLEKIRQAKAQSSDAHSLLSGMFEAE